VYTRGDFKDKKDSALNAPRGCNHELSALSSHRHSASTAKLVFAQLEMGGACGVPRSGAACHIVRCGSGNTGVRHDQEFGALPDRSPESGIIGESGRTTRVAIKPALVGIGQHQLEWSRRNGEPYDSIGRLQREGQDLRNRAEDCGSVDLQPDGSGNRRDSSSNKSPAARTVNAERPPSPGRAPLVTAGPHFAVRQFPHPCRVFFPLNQANCQRASQRGRKTNFEFNVNAHYTSLSQCRRLTSAG
jgi:hypothetical protein